MLAATCCACVITTRRLGLRAPLVACNMPFPSWPKPFKASLSAKPLIWKRFFYFNESKMHFHKNGFFARSLILKVRAFGTRKWPIRICFVFRCNLSLLARFCRFLKFLLVLILHCKCRGMCCDTYPVESSNVQHIALFYLYAIGGGSPRKKAPKSAGSSKTHMPSVKTPADKKQEEVSCSNRLKKTDRL